MTQFFEEFLNKKVKVSYRDGNNLKIARGELIKMDVNFIKITGKLGTLFINKEAIQKMGLLPDEVKK